MRIIAKFHVTAFQQWPGQPDAGQLHLGAVCRGDENRAWAAASPSGTLTLPGDHPDASAALDAYRAVPGPHEVHVLVEVDPDGEWEFKSCDFAYAGVQAKFTRTKRPVGDHRPGEMAMTVNASDATAALREAFATALLTGEPARVRVWTEPVH